MLADIWSRLVRGGADRRSAFHTPVVASVNSDGDVSQRVMVLRKCEAAKATLRFHTDNRSAKVNELVRDVCVLGYDQTAKVQIRASGRGVMDSQGSAADAAWAASNPSSRRCYLAMPGPGTVIEMPSSGLPSSIETRVPDIAETEAGRPNFAVLIVTLHRLEWLYLAHNGHRRARFDRAGDGWQGVWLVP